DALHSSPLLSFPTRRSSDLVALRPSEFLGAELKTLDKMPRREWQFLALVDLRFVQNAELHRIDFELERQLVERRFGCIEAGYARSEEHTSELQSRSDLVCRL